MRNIVSLCLVFAFSLSAFSQQSIQWQKLLQAGCIDVANSVCEASDGGYVIAGYTSSANVQGHIGGNDYLIWKLDSAGNAIWIHCYGGIYDDQATCIQRTSDNGYIVAGFSYSDDTYVTGNHGGYDYWILKLDEGGNLVWQKCFGGDGDDEAMSIQQTTDGGYIIAGFSSTDDESGDVTGNHGNYDYWILKIDSSANLQWEKSLGGTAGDDAMSIVQVQDGGYVVAGYIDSNDGDITFNHGVSDYWVIKLDENGNVIWQNSYGGSNFDHAYSLDKTSDGGCIVAGCSYSTDDEITNLYGLDDYWIIKLDTAGNLQWQKSFGGSSYDEPHSIQQTNDGGYIIAGSSKSNDDDLTCNYGYEDCWLVKLDNSGDMEWQENIGTTNPECAMSIRQTSDNGYISAGYQDLGNFEPNFWIFKLKGLATGMEHTSSSSSSIKVFPNPTSQEVNIEKTKTGIKSIEITDVLGNEVLNKMLISYKGSSVTLDISNLVPGTYFIKATDEMNVVSITKMQKSN